MKKFDRTNVAKRITELSEEQVEKVLTFMDEAESRQAGGGNRRGGMGKIAWRGLIGRKRDTLLLWTVVVLAFLFLALPTTLITSIEATDAANREQTYGKWQLMAHGLTPEGAEELAALGTNAAVTPLIEVAGADYYQGDNSYTLGVYSPELAEMGSFQLREGRWPEAKNEIVLEYARLASLGLEVGDEFTVQSQLELPMTAEHIIKNMESENECRMEYQNSLRENCLDLFCTGDWEIYTYLDELWDWDMNRLKPNRDVLRAGNTTFVTELYQDRGIAEWSHYAPQDKGSSFFLWWYVGYQNYADLFIDEEHPYGQEIPLWELTEEQFGTALDYFLEECYVPRFYNVPPPGRVSELIGMDGLSVRADGKDGPAMTDPLLLSLTRTYTVCGVIDTYTDHWDSGRLILPGGFITEESYQFMLDGIQAVMDKNPGYVHKEYNSMALLQSAGDASALWQDATKIYNRRALETCDFTAPVFERRLLDPELDAFGELLSAPAKNLRTQLQFSFSLGDLEHLFQSDIYQVKAWVEFPEPVTTGYISDHLLSDEDGMWFHSVRGSMDQLLTTSEEYFLIRETGEVSSPKWSYIFGPDVMLYGDLDTAKVDFYVNDELYQISLADFMSRNFSINGLHPIIPEKVIWADAQPDTQTDFAALRTNRLAYPASVESTDTVLAAVMGILFVSTVCAVFQICFTQLRRRTRRIVLLKSMGAETRQVAQLLGWEFLYFWLTALPVGLALGLSGAWAVTSVLSAVQERAILLVLDPAVLLGAVLAGTLALALGMAIPGVMAAGVPLTGRTIRRKSLAPPKKDVRQDFLHVSLRGLAARKGRTVGSFVLCAFMMTIAVLCLFLSFQFLGEYRDTVIRDGKPDYLLRAPYAMSTRQRSEYLAELEELGVCGDVTSYFTGEDMDLDRSAWEDSFLLTLAAGDAESYSVDIYTLSSEDALFEQFQSAATVGALDPEAFDQGREVLLAVPLYRDTGNVNEGAVQTAEGWDRLAAAGVETSYLAEYDGVYLRDEAVQVGDVLHLETVSTSIEGDSYRQQETEADVTVGALLYYFPDTGLWPLSGSGEGYQIVAAPQLLRTLLPAAGTTLNTQTVRALYLQQNAMSALDGAYGATDFYITCAEDVEKRDADTALLIFARNHYMEIEVYHESSEMLLRNAVSSILLACLLGMSAVLLALVIFYNTISSDIEQERPRIGILQSLGVSARLFTARQAVVGLAASGAAVVAANALLWGGVALFVYATGAVLGNLLWGYPAFWHMLLCAALAGIIIFLFVLPMRGVGRYLPVENIRSKK